MLAIIFGDSKGRTSPERIDPVIAGFNSTQRREGKRKAIMSLVLTSFQWGWISRQATLESVVLERLGSDDSISPLK